MKLVVAVLAGVLGAGIMGGGIAYQSASRGVPRITSAPNREMSYLLVKLVAIST